MKIVEYNNTRHRHQVIELWQTVFGYEADHNNPEVVIDKKLETRDGLFFVAEKDMAVVGTVMAGYDGHRGWIYALVVHPQQQRQGIGSALLSVAQQKLARLGCLKINLQVLEENKTVQRFYAANGYGVEKRISMGKRLY